MIALNSTIDGPSKSAIGYFAEKHLDWVFSNSNGPVVVKTRVSQFFQLIAQNCSPLLVRDNVTQQQFVQWYCTTINEEQNPQVVYSTALAMSHLFI